MTRWTIGLAALAGATLLATARAQEAAPLPPDLGLGGPEVNLTDVQKESPDELAQATGGDNKRFAVVTDDDVSGLTVGDVYKSNMSFFRVVEIPSKGTKGGRFIVERVGGSIDPGRHWNRVAGLGPLTIIKRETMLDRFLAGGFLMYPIAFLLLAAIVITLSSLLVYRRGRQCPWSFITAARNALRGGQFEQFSTLAARQGGLFGHLCRAMTVDFDRTAVDDIRTRCEIEGAKHIELLRAPLKGLNFIGAIAPLIGLLGTVVGMIMCFDSLSAEAASPAKSQALASGIKVALLTTVAGLTVAVPALFVYFLFDTKLNFMVSDCATTAEEFIQELERIKANRPADAGAGAAGEARP